MTDKDDIAAQRAQLKAELVEELKRELAPKPQPSREDQERATAEWIDKMHQMREGRMSLATPPSVVRDLAVLDDRLVKEIALRDARAPTSPSGMVPSTPQSSGVRGAGDGTGYVDPRPLTNPPGTNWVDAIAIADEARQRAELKRKLGE
jgi:hypothetical protein